MDSDFISLYNIFLLDECIKFPDVDFTLDGIIGFGGDFNTYRLLDAYSQGIFPWPNEDEIFWFLPDMRMMLYPQNFKYPKSLRQIIRNKGFEIRVDTQFRNIMQHCADFRGKDRDATWILPDMLDAYEYLHKLGLAHSFETYLDGKLVGGLYGISLGSAFFGESMFSLVPNASKVALHFLSQQAKAWDFSFIDVQVYNQHFDKMGAYEIPNIIFQQELKQALKNKTKQGLWTSKVSLDLFYKLD